MTTATTTLEQQVFALALSEPGAIAHFSQNLSPLVMGMNGKGSQEFYGALCAFHAITGADPIEEAPFKAWLETDTLIYDALGGQEAVERYLEDIKRVEVDSTPRTVSAVLQSQYNRSKQKELNDELADILSGKEPESQEKIGEILAQLHQYNRSLEDPLASVYDGSRIAHDAVSLWELPDFMPTQFKALNKRMGYTEKSGFCKGAVHAVLAPSGRGKSTFVKCIMNNWVEEGHRVLYVNYEEAKAHWERVLFTQVTKQNVYEGDSLSELQKRHYTRVFQDKLLEWGDRFLVKHDPETPYYEDLEMWVRDVASRNGAPDALIIDTIQSMYLKTAQGQARWVQFEAMMVRMEKLAKDLNCAIIITAQENSNRMKEKREVVQQSDIGGSLAIAQKSSVTIFITDAKSETHNDAEDEYIMQLQIPKNRITGTTFMMDPPLVKYDDTIKSYVNIELPSASRYEKATVGADDLNPY